MKVVKNGKNNNIKRGPKLGPSISNFQIYKQKIKVKWSSNFLPSGKSLQLLLCLLVRRTLLRRLLRRLNCQSIIAEEFLQQIKLKRLRLTLEPPPILRQIQLVRSITIINPYRQTFGEWLRGFSGNFFQKKCFTVLWRHYGRSLKRVTWHKN